jgi:hypothetical protein
MEAGLCLLLLLAFGATAFNLDVRIPVIKVGAFDSYFGYSVAQHRTLRSLDYGQSLLLVGAPRDDNLQPNTTRSGALWQCRLSSDTKVQQHGVDGLSLFGALRFCAPLLFLVVHAIHNYAHEVAPPPPGPRRRTSQQLLLRTTLFPALVELNHHRSRPTKLSPESCTRIERAGRGFPSSRHA